jgi:hypothetical protein
MMGAGRRTRELLSRGAEEQGEGERGRITNPQSPIPNDVRLSVVELQSQTDPDFDKLYSVSRF